ncbi:MAG: XRE family transcriptional regulator [Actinobacteria bacterium HGW-Actinobacteria-10]|nr:MAG: XRE family transcriptional regulator [Actinobacteria bacterium HGW-Actinobacteria-10]
MAAEMKSTWVPDVPVPPGDTIREMLEARGIPQSDFALRLGKSEKFVSQLINGKATLSHETALELEKVLGVSSAFWNNAEATYRDLLARQRTKEAAPDQTEWVASFPLKEMERHGWIAREANPAEQAEELLSYFGVSTVQAYRDYWGSEKRLAARMSTAYTPETSAVAAWLRAGERMAEEIRTEPFSESGFRIALGVLRGATRLTPDEWIALMRKECAHAGVAVVLVPDLPKTRCHAVSWWTSRTRAVIQLGLRYKTDDQVWFSFFHEAGHILLDERGRSGISDLDRGPHIETRANRFATDYLIPPAEYDVFVAAGRPSKADVRAFAKRIGISPSIVAGRLRHDGVIPRTWMHDLHVRLDWDR